MKIAVDANVLLRFLVRDDPGQAEIARCELDRAERLLFPTAALLEVVWVLGRRYGLNKSDIASRLRALTEVENAEFDRPAIEAGLSVLEAGGDFADGVIARQARDLGADVLVTFDRKAVAHLTALGMATRLARA